MVGMLRARIGEAKGAIARGNMPYAREILDETIDRADRHGLGAVKAMALHDRSSVSFLSGEYELAIRLAYDALSGTDSARERDRILGDIASSFFRLGVHSAARDAYLILAATAQEQYTRWLATLNLMEVAAVDGDELLFEQYRRSVDVRLLPAQLEVLYWLQGGKSYEQFGKLNDARAFLEKALSFAEEQEFYQFVFEADAALRGLGSTQRRRVPSSVLFDEEVETIATRLSAQRQEIGA